MGDCGRDLSAGPMPGADYTLGQIEREHILRITAPTSTLDEEAAHFLGIDPSTPLARYKAYDMADQC